MRNGYITNDLRPMRNPYTASPTLVPGYAEPAQDPFAPREAPPAIVVENKGKKRPKPRK